MSNFDPIDLDSSANTRCTFCFPCCFSSRRSPSINFTWWERVRNTSQSETHPVTGSAGNRWWSRDFMKVREWSEIVAGPRWKTFIRRFNRNKSGGLRNNGKYQYDPLSYALNFDEGPGQNGDFEDEGYEGFRNFGTRYAAATPIKSVSTDAGQDVAVFR
ncbi:hypothetical protein Lal_00015242 [Lupinus albus]|uniref:Uncharacterized protein n=1 Tax=Lupinus albus TaxID=3870 RepID=A0A6A5MJP2_LUPAL|nr:hypothetical protein Lalb_Chr08g0236341 [Lupinus albus]KAF1870942.1 hypothetical protein Lal_00015242 [Lupinus albus]